MARRKRLEPSVAQSETGENSHVSDDLAQSEPMAAPEVKAALRPPGGFGSAPPIARVAAESAAEAALSEISTAMAQARAEGRLVLRLPLHEIEADHLVRDRIGLDEDELAGLMASISEHGQRNPVEVSEIAPGRYGLISGWRRLTALRRLAAEGTGRFSHILALVRRPETAADAYIAMVEENEIRLGLSYYERARIAARATAQGVFPSEREALRRLFANASRSRRSKIGSFLALYHHFDGALRFPEAIPERLGLALEKRLEEADPAITETFLAGLRGRPAQDAAEEQARLTAFAAADPVQAGGQNAENVSHAKHFPPEVQSDPRRRTPVSPVPQRGDPVPQDEAEICPGIFLAAGGDLSHPSLTLTGPGLDPGFRARLEAWLRGQGSD
ncbi:ParB/RepB/Spo0J family partition protein [Pseudogemmobacter humi]|uniref:Nucleoid occlusion protein n=1 Tax=Pseudogemmobacter humi TaxID=2483812 RepID=A0A3P5XT10_9RHOB|nr:ParB N-terminal domain-containing protein [Pseudogemmobacter humi]VDC33959.1 Nucleoid occlusion protein [Pseudogemmobacter humi]